MAVEVGKGPFKKVKWEKEIQMDSEPKNAKL
jgi:hypothetical protein